MILFSNMRFIVMLVTAVCVLFLIKLRWPKRKNFYVKWLFSCPPKWEKAGFRVMSKDFEIRKSFICSSLFRYHIKQIDSMLPCVCSVRDHRRRQNVVRTLVTYSAIASCATSLFLPHFDVICDLLLNRHGNMESIC